MSLTILGLCRGARMKNASDIHIVVGLPPIFRVDGEIVVAKDQPVTPEVSRELAYECLNDDQKRKLDTEWQLCFSTTFGEKDRARITVYFRNGAPELSIRLSEPLIRTSEDLHLPPIIEDLVRRPNGLVILTGPTGVGKTTTFHYMLDRINSEFRKKIVTIEDPIEFTHSPKRAIVVQLELLTDVHSFPAALVHVLRQDPNVIGIGEMRDRETMHTALLAAETGHLVVATLHTPDAVQSVQRIVSSFPEGQQSEIRHMVANTLQAVIAQQLLPRATGGRRLLCCEVLVGTPGIRNRIRDNSVHMIYSDIQAGRKHGMVTMDHALLELYQKGEITYDTAVTMARTPASILERSA